jgi:serine/threonine protein kinase
MHVKETPEPLLKRAPDLKLPKNFEKVVMRALSKNPDERPQSAKELSHELRESFPLDYDDHSSSYTFTGLRTPRLEKGTRKRPMLVVGSAIAVAVLVVAGAFALQTGDSNVEPQPSALLDTPAVPPGPTITPPAVTAETVIKNPDVKSEETVKASQSDARERAALMKLLMDDSVKPKVEIPVEKPKEIIPPPPQPKPEALEVKKASTPPPEIPVKTVAPAEIEKPKAVEKPKEIEKPKSVQPKPEARIVTKPEKDAAQLEAERRLLEAQRRTAELERKARDAQRQAREAEQRRLAAEARRRREQETAPPPPPPEPKADEPSRQTPPPQIRRRCGPTWCP